MRTNTSIKTFATAQGAMAQDIAYMKGRMDGAAAD